ncbi:MAG: transporter substrate-binding domain-containing protein [Herbinix sp.]|nr:transporter substrate-binding domain-containing protein [Herbinix sp.]
MKKKVLSIMLITTLVATLFAGCGTKEETGSNGDAENATITESAEATEAPEATQAPAAEGNGELIVGTEAGFAPYEFLEGDQVVGIDMDIAQAIADAMGKELVIKNMDFDGALMAVQNGTIDLVAAGVSIDADRQKVMDFSDPYVDSTEVVVVNKANPAVATVDSDGLAGKVIGVQQGNIADFWVEDNIDAKETKRYTKFGQAAEDLKNEKIDCIVMDQYPAEDLVKSNPELSILDGTLFQDKYAIAVKKGNTELLDQINAVIKDLKDSGKMDEFTAKYTSK